MATSEASKSKGSKLNRSETVTVRLDPKLRYLAELAARKQRRTLSSYIEWAIEQSLENVMLKESRLGIATVANKASSLYDVDELDRLVKLALLYPELLVYEEQVIWKLITKNGLFWHGSYESDHIWRWKISQETLKFTVLRKHWDTLKRIAKEELSEDALPDWEPPPQTPQNTIKESTLDDDIPF